MIPSIASVVNSAPQGRRPAAAAAEPTSLATAETARLQLRQPTHLVPYHTVRLLEAPCRQATPCSLPMRTPCHHNVNVRQRSGGAGDAPGLAIASPSNSMQHPSSTPPLG